VKNGVYSKAMQIFVKLLYAICEISNLPCALNFTAIFMILYTICCSHDIISYNLLNEALQIAIIS